jgi:hypothetical protein
MSKKISLGLYTDTPTQRIVAMQMILDERDRQIELWGDVYFDNYCDVICKLGEEFGELCEAINETMSSKPKRPELAGTANMLKEAAQVAAVATKFMEQLILLEGENNAS